MSKVIQNVHDRTFHLLIREPQFAPALLKQHLPPTLVEKIEWNTLELHQLDGRHVRSDLKGEAQADVLYSANVKGEKGFFHIHVEHQSRPNWLMPVRLLNYQTNFLLDYAKKLTKGKKLPCLISMLYYHGKQSPYPYSMDWFDCFESPADAAQHMAKPILIDLSQYDDKSLQTQPPELAGVELIFKYIWAKDFTDYLPMVFKALQGAQHLAI